MTTLADKLNLGPQRTSVRGADGSWTVTVTPPEWSGFRASTLNLTDNQHARYQSWRAGQGYIQDMLPELSDADREVLLSGISGYEFDAEFGDDEE